MQYDKRLFIVLVVPFCSFTLSHSNSLLCVRKLVDH